MLVSEPAVTDQKFGQIEATLPRKIKVDEDRFTRLESMLEVMQTQVTHLDFNRESTVNRVEHRLIRTVSPHIQEFSPIQVPKPKLTFVNGFKKLTEATYSKFMKLAKLDFPKYSGASGPTY